MGTFLAIGIATEFNFRKKDIINAFHSLDEARKAVSEQLAPSALYDERDEGDFISYYIKERIFMEELCDFLLHFYALRYTEKERKFGEELVARIRKLPSFSKIIELAERKEEEFFQFDELWSNVYIDGGIFYPLPVSVCGIDLSLDGKIMMECYNSLFAFITRMIRANLSQFRLAGALRITITG